MAASISQYQQFEQKMAAEFADKTTEQLCTTLLLLEAVAGDRGLDNAGRMVRASLSDEICRRVPEADAAAERWTFDPAMWESDITMTEVIVSTALANA